MSSRRTRPRSPARAIPVRRRRGRLLVGRARAPGTRSSRSCAAIRARRRGGRRASSTSARRARTCSTRRRCSSRGTRSRCSARSSTASPRLRPARARRTDRRRPSGARSCSGPCRPPSARARRAGSSACSTRATRSAATPVPGSARRRRGHARAARRPGARRGRRSSRRARSRRARGPVAYGPAPGARDRRRPRRGRIGVREDRGRRRAARSRTRSARSAPRDGGGSSTMPQKRNPVDAVLALACARPCSERRASSTERRARARARRGRLARRVAARSSRARDSQAAAAAAARRARGRRDRRRPHAGRTRAGERRPSGRRRLRRPRSRPLRRMTPALVLSNALGTDPASSGTRQMPALESQFRVLRYEHRAAVERRRARAPTSSSCSTSIGVDRVSFCGISLGGAVGMWLAADAPERVERLVVACTARTLRRQRRVPRAARGDVRAEGTGRSSTRRRRWFTPRGSRDRRPDSATMLRDAAPRGLRRLLRGARGAGTSASDSREISTPTLVVAGAEDPATPPEHAAGDRRRHPRRPTLVAPRRAHLANVEQADALHRRPYSSTSHERDGGRGTSARRAVLGDDARRPRRSAHDRRSPPTSRTSITRYAWGEIWSRPGLDLADPERASRSPRSSPSAAIDELEMHIRAARRNGVTVERAQRGAAAVRDLLRRARREQRVRDRRSACWPTK